MLGVGLLLSILNMTLSYLRFLIKTLQIYEVRIQTVAEMMSCDYIPNFFELLYKDISDSTLKGIRILAIRLQLTLCI